MFDTLKTGSILRRLLARSEALRLPARMAIGPSFNDHVRAADQARDAQDWPLAVEFYRRALEIDPTATAMAVQLGHALKESGEYDAAAEMYEAVLEKTPADDDLHLQIGHLEKIRGELRHAAEHYGKAVELNADNLDAQQELTALAERALDEGGKESDATGAGLADRGSRPAAAGTHARPAKPKPKPPIRPKPLVDPAVHLHTAHAARKAERWGDAAAAYSAYLAAMPRDVAVWTQYGNVLKETGALPESEAAYRVGLDVDPTDADLHLQLGHLLNQLGRRDDALASFRESFLKAPLRETLAELRALDVDTPLDDLAVTDPARAVQTQFEITDLLAVMASQAVVSGIQRVQFGILSHVLSLADGAAGPVPNFVGLYDGEMWTLPSSLLIELVRHYATAGGKEFDAQRTLIHRTIDKARLVRPVRGDVFVTTGVVYFTRDGVRHRSRLAAAGVRLGLHVYDYIPLSNPEFCAPVLIQDFAPSMAEALLQVDFVVTISEFVAKETVRLLHQAGYPAIPVRAVPLARDDEGAHDKAPPEEPWTSTIAELRDTEYVFCIGTLNAHKNHVFLLHVWRMLLREGVRMPKLVLAGRRNYGVDDLFHQLHSSRNLDDHVILLDGPTDEEVATLYDNCLFTMLPSYVEGWGLPVGESLARGKPCLASSTTAIPEVGGDLVLYFDPHDVNSAARIVRRLLDDRLELKALEALIRAEFKLRSWNEYGRDFVQAVSELAVPKALPPAGPRLASGQTLQMRPPPATWLFGSRLPPVDTMRSVLLPRLVLGSGWTQGGDLGAAMVAPTARLEIPTDAAAGTRLDLVLQLQARRPNGRATIEVTSGCGARVSAGPPLDGRRDLLVRIPCIAGPGGHVTLDFAAPPAMGVRLLSLAWSAGDADGILPALRLHRPVSLTAGGFPAPARGAALVTTALLRRSMLADNWLEPEAWGTWMAGHEARIAFRTAPAATPAVTPGTAGSYQVLLRLRPTRAAVGMTVSAKSGPAIASQTVTDQPIVLALECQPGPQGRIEITLRLAAAPGRPAPMPPLLGLEGLAYGPADTDASRLALAEAVLFTPGPTDDAIVPQLRYTVVGHVSGTYSLANVNRELACAIEATHPGHVRLHQVEGVPTRNLGNIPGDQRPAIRALTDRLTHADGLEVTISQHWPVHVPAERGDLGLALTFWEEGLLPRDMVETLNNGFDAVLAPSRSVGKALVDSGVAVPVRQVGFAPDLAGFAAVGAARIKTPRAADGFTFLHVSSCFPRKGADALLAAYARAFTAADQVRLVIKTFPNPHNDVEEQIGKLKADNPDLAPIEVINRDVGTGALHRLYAEADSMVLPTRGEGFNIPAAEAMAAGLALIVTGFGAHLDFAEPAFARLVDYRFALSGSHLASSGSTWVDPDIDDLAAAMRETLDRARTNPAAAARRIRLGRAAAAALADQAAWVRRIGAATVDVLVAPPRTSPTIAWVSSWDVRCGIAEYSRMLLTDYPAAARDVVVLCDERTGGDRPGTGNLPRATVTWRPHDSASMERTAAEIDTLDPGLIVIQNHPGLIRFADLATLLQDPRVAPRPTIVVLHNVVDMPPRGDKDHARLVAALSAVSRIFVHSAKDLNLLKGHGLVGNVTIFPHGAPTSTFKPRPPRTLSVDRPPLIGTYGFILPHKGFALLIEAFAAIRYNWPGARLRMVTAEYPISFSAETLAECRAVAQSLNLDHAIDWHTDYLPADESLALLNECDVVVLPYRETPESSSAAVRTAIASGAPVMVTPAAIFQDVGHAVLRTHGMEVSFIVGGVGWLLGNERARGHIQAEAARWQHANSWAMLSERLHAIARALVSPSPSLAAPSSALRVPDPA